MHNQALQKALGIFCIIAGATIFALSIGKLIARIIFALLGLAIINYGLQLRNNQPLLVIIRNVRNSFWF